MNNKLKDLPLDVLPRERLMKYGKAALADYELLAIILRCGSKDLSVLDLSKELLIKYKGINNFNDLTLNELITNKGIKKAKAVEILAAIEFGKRVLCSKKDLFKVKSSNSLYEYIRYDMENLLEEEVKVAYLNNKGEVLDLLTLSKGSNESVSIDYRKIFRYAIKILSYYIIIIHNHPSGDCNPSKHDCEFTSELINYGNFVGVSVVDHIIIGKNNYYSFKDNKVM